MNPVAIARTRARPRRGLIRLLTLDAFGTLYAPSEPIGTQYVSVARRYGLGAIEDRAADVDEKFREGEAQDTVNSHSQQSQSQSQTFSPGHRTLDVGEIF